MAAVSDHAVATWNTHAKGANLDAARAIVTQKNLALMALQEVRDDVLPGTPGTPIIVNRINPHSPPGANPTTSTVDQSAWTVNGTTLYLYRIKHSDPSSQYRQSKDRSIAVISRRQMAAGDLRVVVPRKDRKNKLPFLALGVKYVDAWFYSIHATTEAPRRDNNADLLIEDISLAQESATDPHKNNWAALGDFNRLPVSKANTSPNEKPLKDNLALDPGEQIIHQTLVTYRSKRGAVISSAQLDYMFAQGATTAYKATRLNQGGSDHYPVAFSTTSVTPGACSVPPAPAAASGPRPKSTPARCPRTGTPRPTLPGTAATAPTSPRSPGPTSTTSPGNSASTSPAPEPRPTM
ncbi:endonuclease/exonuclease/phosphatase family protein [Streptomyces sp. NBC_00690]|uniref:endonuclease/exonuclease/phosphatase family protein n=1 Tax=Streptomyces sp. NBC_00690 TaxID=2975808 RepID=UPI002E29B984|nr:endonuclease/exonuclease/phosphatase family protein [Streptomyces sp. NBC_00690]